MKIGPYRIEEINGMIGNLISQILPPQHLVPATKITLHAAEAGDNSIRWAVEVEQSIKEFTFTMTGEMPEEEKKKSKLMLIGDERVPNGVYILHSMVEGRMIRLKFNTKEESLAYRNHFGLGGYIPERITTAIADDFWFTGELKHPDNYGYREVKRANQ